MPLTNGFPGHSALATFADIRRDLEGAVVRNAAGVMRAGVFPDHTNPLVTSTASMKVAIADHRAVLNRGGAVFLANVGTDQTLQLPAAPSANRRIDLVYEVQQSVTLGDTASTAAFGYVQGVASPTPTVPALPSNLLSHALPLASVEIPAGATSLKSAGVVITQLYPYTTMAGGTVTVRSDVELAAWTPADGARAFCLSNGITYDRVGGAWEPTCPQIGRYSFGENLDPGVQKNLTYSPLLIPAESSSAIGAVVSPRPGGFTALRTGIFAVSVTMQMQVGNPAIPIPAGRHFLQLNSSNQTRMSRLSIPGGVNESDWAASFGEFYLKKGSTLSLAGFHSAPQVVSFVGYLTIASS